MAKGRIGPLTTLGITTPWYPTSGRTSLPTLTTTIEALARPIRLGGARLIKLPDRHYRLILRGRK